MAKPKMTRAGMEGDTHPRCPHCGGDMWDAPLTLSEVMVGWPHSGFVRVDGDGYANPGEYLEVDCPDCKKPSAVTFERSGWVKLIAARTPADKQYMVDPRCKLTMEMF